MNQKLLVVFIFVTAAICLQTVATAAEVPPGYDRSVRPDPEGTPTSVEVGVFILDVTEINDIEQSFTAGLYFDVSYHDPRLADPSAPGIRTFGLDDIWWPDLGIVNRRDIELIFPHVLKVDREGNVHYIQRAFGDFSARLDLRKFPFDAQRLPIEIVSFSFGPEVLDLVLDTERSGRLESLSLSGWTVLTGGVDTLPKRGDALKHEQLVFHIDVVRKVPFYRWSILVPLCLIVLMAWCVFWIDPQFLPSQIGLSTASVFSLIAFRFSLRALLPKLDYLTYLDEFVFASTVLVFLALGQAIATGRLAKMGHESLAHRIDVWTRSIYLVVFVALALATLRFNF